jgi:hypothetical protein
MDDKNKIEGEDFEESRELPPEEFVDFLTTYLESKWSGIKQEDEK